MTTAAIIDPDTRRFAVYRLDPQTCDHDYLDVYLVEGGVVCCGCGTFLPTA